MKYTYHTKGVCASRIELEITDGKIVQAAFVNGCNGNLSALSKLIAGKPAKEARDILAGITCGPRRTSCPDQLAHAIDEALLMAQIGES